MLTLLVVENVFFGYFFCGRGGWVDCGVMLR